MRGISFLLERMAICTRHTKTVMNTDKSLCKRGWCKEPSLEKIIPVGRLVISPHHTQEITKRSLRFKVRLGALAFNATQLSLSDG